MHEILTQITAYTRGIWRYRWYMMAISWVFALGSWTYIYFMPDKYEASARIYVDTESVLRPLLRGLAVQTDLSQQVRIMTRTLLSRPNLQKVIQMTDMDLQVENDRQMDALVDRLGREIVLKGAGAENLYMITYLNRDPVVAKKVVESLLTLLVEGSLGDKRKDTNMAQQFLEQQITDYETRLIEAENVLKEFKQKNIGLMPAEGRGYYDNLQAAMGELQRAKLEMEEVQNRRDELQRQLRGEEPTFGVVSQARSGSNITMSPRRQQLQAQLDDVLLRYTPQHPDAIVLKQAIADLEKQEMKNGIDTSVTYDSNNNSLVANPVYQQMRISLAEADATLASMRARVAEYQRRVTDLRLKMDTVPQVEAALAQLNRDYEVNRKNYESLLTRRESAKISQEAEQSSDNVKFKVIDPPHVPQTPAAPNRTWLYSLSLLACLLIGAAFTIFLSQIKPVFFDRKSLYRTIGLPVLGSVSMVWVPGQLAIRRRELLLYIAASIGLAIAYGSILYYQNFIYNAVH